MAERNDDRPVAPSLVSAPAGFFDGGDRRTHLEQLRHLSQWSRRVLLVTGPRGVGKSALYRQLSASLEPRAKAARINGTLVNADREVLNAVVQGFGLAAPVDADTQLLRQLIGEHAEAQERSDRFCVTLIDDAELLEVRALEHLITLAAESPMRLVLFGEVRLVPAVERFADARNVGWHEIRLTGFRSEEVRSYLAWRLREQGYSGALPFSDSQVREIARLSEGLPGRIDQMANVLLARTRSAGAGPGGRRFPAVHKALLAVLVVSLGIAYLLWQPGDAPQRVGPADVEPLDVPPQTAQRPPPEPDESGRSAHEQPEPVPRPGEEAAPAAPPDNAQSLTPDPQRGSATDAAPAGTPASAELEQQPEPQTEPQPVPQADPRAAPDAPAESPARPEQQQQPQSPPQVERQPEPRPERAAEAQAPAVQPPPVAAPGDAAGAGRDATWIMQQPASAYTLQLVSFSTAERADRYLAGQSRPEDFARFRQQHDSRTLHVVVYGRFDSRAAAQQAAAELPPGAGTVQPWIRTFGEVQGAVRTALQP